MNQALLTSKTPEWATPQDFFDRLNQEFNFTLDPCANIGNAKCKRFFTILEDGLKQDWSEERVFMNPPYGREIGKWVQKAAEGGAEVVIALLPARTDTKWWHEYCINREIRFIKGRLKFGGSKNSAPFPSAIVVFKNQPQQ